MLGKMKLRVALARDIKGHKKIFYCYTRINKINKMWSVTKTVRWFSGSSLT